MEITSLKLKHIEPLMFRGPGEFDESSTGVYSYAQSLNLPRPSTIIGALSSILLVKKENQECTHPTSWENLLSKCYAKVLDELGIEAIRGPFIVRGSNFYIPLRLGRKCLYLEYTQTRYLLMKKYGDILKLIFEKNDHSEKQIATLRLFESEIGSHLIKKYSVEPVFTGRTGIHLQSRDPSHTGKVVKEGYIYTANYIAYPPNYEITFLVMVRDYSSFKEEIHNKALKLGGEGRIVKAYIEDAKENNYLYSIFIDKKKLMDTRYAILVSPMPIMKKELNTHFIGEYSTIGYGFSIAKKRRKPITPGLLEGSILRINSYNKETFSEDGIFRYGLYSTLGLSTNEYYKNLGRLGYASYVPITPVG